MAYLVGRHFAHNLVHKTCAQADEHMFVQTTPDRSPYVDLWKIMILYVHTVLPLLVARQVDLIKINDLA